MDGWQAGLAGTVVDVWWEAARRRAVRTAFLRVPFYREQAVVAGRVPPEPEPVAVADLAGELYRLCPLGRQWEPGREPPLWGSRRAGLRRALAMAGVLDRRAAVLEVRPALVEARRLRPAGPAYAPVLAPGADTGGADRWAELDRRPAGLAASAGRVVLVGPPGEAEAVLARLGLGEAGDGVEVVHRLAPADVPAGPGRAPVVVTDPLLGDVGARRPGCGLVHLDWRRWHARAGDDGLVLTALARRRPTIVGVVVPAPGVAVTRCPRHGTPVLAADDRGRAGSPPGPRPSPR